MTITRKWIVIIFCAVLCFFAGAVVASYRPKRHIVIELEGPANCDYETVLLVDGQRQRHTVTLPKTFRFYARQVLYRVSAKDASNGNEVSGHMYTENKLIDFTTSGSATGGRIESPSLLGPRASDFQGGFSESWFP